MKSNLSLNLLYSFEPGANTGYKILYLFSELGFIDHHALLKKYETQDGHFADLDLLARFALEVCIDYHAPEIFLLSTQDYNQNIVAAKDARAFREFFRRYGECIPNPEVTGRKSVLGRLFNRENK
jgi:hypothetical protein